MKSSASTQDHDERRLAELGYKQSLNRAWSSFSNRAAVEIDAFESAVTGWDRYRGFERL